MPPRSQVLLARGPFTVDGELAMLREHAIDVVVAKDSGRSAVAKVEAARQLGVPIAMVDRPPAPDMPAVADVTAAMARLHDLTSTAV